jgi:hypothetical protein
LPRVVRARCVRPSIWLGAAEKYDHAICSRSRFLMAHPKRCR